MPRSGEEQPVAVNTTRLASNLSAAVVAGIAAWSSYHHMVSVALSVGERPDVAYVLPLSVDGMLVVASVAMVDDRRNGRRVRWSARLAFVAGVVASVAANVAAAQSTVGARIVAAWPAIALLLTVELLSRTGRLLTRVEPEAAAPPAPAAPPAAAPLVVAPAWEPAYATEMPVSGAPRSYVDDVTPLAAPRRSAPSIPEDPFPTPVSPAVAPATTTLPSSTRIAVAQALPPAGPTAARHASERRARAAQSTTPTTRTSARVSSARPRPAAEDGDN
ncbi:hypothetical protein GCM10009682_04760 [Luedemannella flava]|uniref:DUF2637 domain-containing protein n=1 Tax=Luedemannella flava TaxID=349316 RepID=A0ABN2LEP2_9ACTN